VSPATPEQLVGHLSEAIAAARAAEAERFEQAHALLAAVDRDGAGRVVALQAGVLSELIERRYAGGLAAEDARDLLEAAIRTGAWWSGLNGATMLGVLAGTLGVLDADDQPPPMSAPILAGHASILILELLGPSAAEPVIRTALAEMERAQTIELP
jgi:hypothetical protein